MSVGELLEQLPQKDVQESPTQEMIRLDLVESLFRRHKIRDASLSPDGKKLAYFELNDDSTRRLVVLHKEQRRKLILRVEENEGQQDIRFLSLHWIDNERIAYRFEIFRTTYLSMSTLQFEDGMLVDAFNKPIGPSLRIMDSLPEIDKLAVVFGPIEKNDEAERELRVVDLTDPFDSDDYRWPRRVRKMLEDSVAWLFDANGDVRLILRVDPKTEVRNTFFWDKSAKQWFDLGEFSAETDFQPVMLTPDEKSLFVITDQHTDYQVLARFDIASRAITETLYSVPGADVVLAVPNPDKTKIVRIGYFQDGVMQFDYLETLGDVVESTVELTNERTNAYVVDRSIDEKTLLIVTDDTDDPGEVRIVDADSGADYFVGYSRPWLNDYQLGKSQLVRSVSTDGEVVESYLTLPQRELAAAPPLVVMPHGGPISVTDTRHFNEYVQYLAVLGYAVLQTNYRGSFGYGKDFLEAGEGQWGRLIEDDIESAVEVVIEQGLVDRERICIYGASYGGYSALVSSVRRPDLYQCAASLAGVTDLILRFHNFNLELHEGLREALIDIVGDPEREKEILMEYSPVYMAERMNMPILLAHGTDDERVDFEHYSRMKLVLEYFQKDAEYLVIEGAGHGFNKISDEAIFLIALDEFLRKHLEVEFPPLETLYLADAVDARLENVEKFRPEPDEEEEGSQAANDDDAGVDDNDADDGPSTVIKINLETGDVTELDQ